MTAWRLARGFLGPMLPCFVAASLAAQESAAVAGKPSASAQRAVQAAAASDVAWLLATDPGGTAKPLVAFASPALRRDDRYAGVPGREPVRLLAVSGDGSEKLPDGDVDLILNLDAVGKTKLRTVLFADKAIAANPPVARTITVGWVNLSMAIGYHPEWPRLKESIDKSVAITAKTLAELLGEVEELKNESEELRTKLSTPKLPESERSAMQKRAREVLALIASQTEDARKYRENSTITIRARRWTTGMLLAEDIAEAAAAVAVKRGVDLVLDTSSVDEGGQPMVIVGVGGHDLNAEVIEALRRPEPVERAKERR